MLALRALVATAGVFAGCGAPPPISALDVLGSYGITMSQDVQVTARYDGGRETRATATTQQLYGAPEELTGIEIGYNPGPERFNIRIVDHGRTADYVVGGDVAVADDAEGRPVPFRLGATHLRRVVLDFALSAPSSSRVAPGCLAVFENAIRLEVTAAGLAADVSQLQSYATVADATVAAGDYRSCPNYLNGDSLYIRSHRRDPEGLKVFSDLGIVDASRMGELASIELRAHMTGAKAPPR